MSAALTQRLDLQFGFADGISDGAGLSALPLVIWAPM
jgi:hypothetical protein